MYKKSHTWNTTISRFHQLYLHLWWVLFGMSHSPPPLPTREQRKIPPTTTNHRAMHKRYISTRKFYLTGKITKINLLSIHEHKTIEYLKHLRHTQVQHESIHECHMHGQLSDQHTHTPYGIIWWLCTSTISFLMPDFRSYIGKTIAISRVNHEEQRWEARAQGIRRARAAESETKLQKTRKWLSKGKLD